MSVGIKIFQLAIESLVREVESVRLQNIELKGRVIKLEGKTKIRDISQVNTTSGEIAAEILIDTKEVLAILGVCYNTLQKVVDKGLLIPIRINQRRVRYSKAKVIEYIENLYNL